MHRVIESVRCLTEDYMLNEGDYGPGGRSEGQGFKADYAPKVYYQNWAAKLKWMPSEWSGLYLLWKYIQIKRGDNDIYTPASSQIHDTKHVMNRGILSRAWCAGVRSHGFYRIAEPAESPLRAGTVLDRPGGRFARTGFLRNIVMARGRGLPAAWIINTGRRYICFPNQ